MHFYASFPVRGQETADSGPVGYGLWSMGVMLHINCGLSVLSLSLSLFGAMAAIRNVHLIERT